MQPDDEKQDYPPMIPPSARELRKWRKMDGIPAEARHEQMCQVCQRPMLVSRGQIAKYHGACRKLRRQKKAIISRK